MIWGEGNPNGKVIVILDNPGSRESKEGQYVCGTRQTLQRAAYSAGFSRDELYVTYILKCRPIRKYDKETARAVCSEYLDKQIGEHAYDAAFCLGDTAVKAFFRDPDMTVKEARGVSYQIRGLTIFVSYHPLAVRRRPNLYGVFLEDWARVRDFVSA
jgi:DNA polymerase